MREGILPLPILDSIRATRRRRLRLLWTHPTAQLTLSIPRVCARIPVHLGQLHNDRQPIHLPRRRQRRARQQQSECSVCLAHVASGTRSQASESERNGWNAVLLYSG
jgi:hypothetical protein